MAMINKCHVAEHLSCTYLIGCFFQKFTVNASKAVLKRLARIAQK